MSISFIPNNLYIIVSILIDSDVSTLESRSISTVLTSVYPTISEGKSLLCIRGDI